jgi:hypothetical protein
MTIERRNATKSFTSRCSLDFYLTPSQTGPGQCNIHSQLRRPPTAIRPADQLLDTLPCPWNTAALLFHVAMTTETERQRSQHQMFDFWITISHATTKLSAIFFLWVESKLHYISRSIVVTHLCFVLLFATRTLDLCNAVGEDHVNMMVDGYSG